MNFSPSIIFVTEQRLLAILFAGTVNATMVLGKGVI